MSPPGMELGPDGKPCKVCNSFKSWSKQQSHTQSQAKPQNRESNLQKLVKPTLGDKFGCPVDADELGRQTWTFLHTTASYYPKVASETQQTQMKNLISSFGTFYPCGDCAGHLRSYVKQKPPQVHSRSALELWM